MITKPLFTFYQMINDKSELNVGKRVLNGILVTHQFRNEQLQVENYYTNYIHSYEKVDPVTFYQGFKKLRYVRAIYKVLLESLNTFENVLYIMQLNDNRQGLLPTLPQLYKIITCKYKPHSDFKNLIEEKQINNKEHISSYDYRMLKCIFELRNSNYGILEHYIWRYNRLLGKAGSYLENEDLELITRRVNESYFNMRDTSITKEQIEMIYDSLKK